MGWRPGPVPLCRDASLTRIGILSDTHMPGSLREMWRQVGAAFEGVDLILHSGDICHPLVLDQLERWAPVLAARGNNDLFRSGDQRVADVQWLDIDGFRIAMVHEWNPRTSRSRNCVASTSKVPRPM